MDQEAQRLVGHRRKAFDAQHVEFFRQRSHARSEIRGIGNFAKRYDKTVKIVVIVVQLIIVMGAAIGNVVLGANPQAEQQRRIDLAARVAALAEEFGVLRVKGFAAVANKPLRLLVQAVGSRVTQQYDRPWAASEPRDSRLVVIGLKGLDRAAVTRALAG